MKRYYKLNPSGKILSSYARNQSDIIDLIILEESENPLHTIWNGSEWLPDVEAYGLARIDEMTDYILKKLLQWSKAITAIQAQYNNVFIVSVEGAASMAEVDIIYNDMITWLNAP